MSLGMTMPPPGFNDWGPDVRERNTFLDLSPPAPALVRAKTASALEEEVFSAPPMLPLEFPETPDALNCPQVLAAVPVAAFALQSYEEDPSCSLGTEQEMYQSDTFLDFKPPAMQGLRRAKTDPLPGLEEHDMSEPDAEDSEADPVPPMLPLDYMQTPDALCFPLTPRTPKNSELMLPPGLLAVKLESPVPCRTPSTSEGPSLDDASDASSSCAAGPPPLPLEKFHTFDDFEPCQLPSEMMCGNLQPAYIPLVRIPVLSGGSPISPSETNLDQAEPCAKYRQQINLQEAIPESMVGGSTTSGGPSLDDASDDDFLCFAGPPPLPLEKFNTFDDFEPSQLPLQEVCEDRQPAYILLERVAVLSDGSPISPFETNLDQEEPYAKHRQHINLQEEIPESIVGGSFSLPAMPPPPPMLPAPVLHEEKTSPAPLAAPLEGDAMPPPSADMRPGALVCRSSGSGASYVHWAVDGKKLFSTDARVVSSQFELDIPGHGLQPFKVTLHPKLVINNKRGGGFKKAKGKGSVMLKCESHGSECVPLIEFSIRVGRGSTLQPPRGPVLNNFAEKSLCGLPDGQEEWDFRSLVDESGLLLISVQINASSGLQ
eukprot:TRINITY_DN567_c0_g1_i1.p1 TRINITY_DN567_c0_g1~~TRINITY_DN567_c0_g1_i1.p1  ORF type:complete len:600 (+),score=119.03 TRINITY_DN567_c0_g1_i1:71-1870(+)